MFLSLNLTLLETSKNFVNFLKALHCLSSVSLLEKMNFTKVKPDKSRASFASREYFKRFLKKKANLHWRTANIFCSTHTKTNRLIYTLTNTHLRAYIVQPGPVKSCRLIMQENVLRHMLAWRQTYRSHLLSPGDVLQNLFQLLLDASGPVNHSGK